MGLRYDPPRWVFDQVTGHMFDTDKEDSCLRLAVASPDLFWVQVGMPVDAQNAMAVCWYVSVKTAGPLCGLKLLEAWKASPANPHGDISF